MGIEREREGVKVEQDEKMGDVGVFTNQTFVHTYFGCLLVLNEGGLDLVQEQISSSLIRKIWKLRIIQVFI